MLPVEGWSIGQTDDLLERCSVIQVEAGSQRPDPKLISIPAICTPSFMGVQYAGVSTH
jgi:hypothetical protein